MRRIAVFGTLLLVLGAAAWWLFLREPPQPPTAEIEATRQRAQEAIQRSEAELYAPDAVREVRGLLDRIDALVEEQETRLPFRRNYDGVLEHLRNIDAAVESMEELALRNRHKLEAEVMGLLQQALETANAAETELADFPAVKDGQPVRAAYREQLRQVRERLSAGQSTLAEGRPVAAQPDASAALEQAKALLAEIQETKRRIRVLRERAGFE